MTTFRMPDAVDEMKKELADTTVSGDCWDEIGQPLDNGVLRQVPGYDEKLELRLDPTAEEKRVEISELSWGKLDREAQRLKGLGAALRDIADSVDEGLATIAGHWDGEAARAFTKTATSLVTALRKASATYLESGAAVGKGVEAIRALYGAGEPGGYRELAENMLAFKDLVRPQDIYVLDGERVDEIPLCGFNCHDEESLVYDHTLFPDASVLGRRSTAHRYASNKRLTRHWFRWYAYENPGGMDHENDIDLCVRESAAEFPPITTMIGLWYKSTDALKSSVSDVYRGMLDILDETTKSEIFGQLKQDLGL
jgi:uncharacterized protein YukE